MTSSAGAQSTIDPALSFTLSSPSKIALETNSTVTGSVGAIGNLTVGTRSTVTSDAASLGKLKLRNKSTVGGTCASVNQFKIPKSATCANPEFGPGSEALIPLFAIPSTGVTFCPSVGTSQGALNLKRGATSTLAVTDGVQVVDFTSIKLARAAILTISGPSDAVVIIVDSGILKLAKNALITTNGVVPVGNVLILVGSTTPPFSSPKVSLSAATITASLFSAGACNLSTGSTVAGQVYCGGNTKLGRGAVIGGNPLLSPTADAVTCP